MDDHQLKECYNFIVGLTKECGEFILEGIKNASKEIHVKGRHWDFVTEYDTKVEEGLISGILSKYPDHKFLAEESVGQKISEMVLTDEPTWVIDPIDGTNNFIHGIGFICISIALAIEKDVKIAIIYNPCRDELFSAQKGKGAFRNGEQIFTSNVEDLKHALVAHEMSIASYEPVREILLDQAREFIKHCTGMRAFGCAALTLAYLAAGHVDVYTIEYLKPWDIAAGSLLIKEAGGIIVGVDGKDYDIMKPDIIATSTEKLLETVFSIVQSTKQKIRQ